VLNNYPKTALRASALYVAALDQRSLGDDAAAGTILRDIVASYPNSPFIYDARLLIGETLSGEGKFDEAIAHYKKLQADAPASRRAAATFGLGMAQSQAGRYGEAQKTFESVATDYKNSSFAGPARLQYAIAELKSGAHANARELLANVGKEFPSLANSAAYWSARCDILDGKYEAAKGLLERLAATKSPEQAEVEFDLAYCELMLGGDNEALKRLEAFRAAYPRSTHTAEALYYEATALHRQGQFEKAIQFCDAAVTYPRNTIARQSMLLKGESLLMLNQYDKADAVFAGLEKQPASDAEKLRIEMRRGQCAYFSGDYKTAESRLSEVASNPISARDPVLQEATFLLGDAQLQQGNNEAAATTLREYLRGSKSRSDEATFKLALAQIGSKDTQAGAETLRNVMKGDLRSQWVQRAWYEFGQLAYQSKNPTDARASVEKVLAAKPAEAIAAPAMYLLARIDMDAGQFAAAAQDLDKIIAAYPKNPLAEDAAFSRGICLKEAKQPADAQRQFTLYMQTYPAGKHVAEARHQAAVCMAALGKTSDAVKALTDLANRKETRNDGVLYDLAWAYRGGNDAAKAAETYEELLREFPKSAKAGAARVELPELLFAEKRYQQAAELLVAAVNDPSLEPRLKSVALFRLGYTYARLNDPAKAAATFDAFAREFPRDSQVAGAISEAGDAYAKLNQLDEAKRHQARVLKEFPRTPAAKVALLRFGEAQNQGGEYDAAAKTFDRWLNDNPNDSLAPRAHFGIGWSLENRGQYDEAREEYAKVIAADNGITAARAQFQIGETYFAQKQFAAAAKELLKVDILYTAPEWAARALYETGRAFEQTKELDRAKQQYRDCVKKYKTSDVAPMARKRLEALGG
jgi:TolA-binding protein